MWPNCKFVLAQVQPTDDKKDLHMSSAHCTCVYFLTPYVKPFAKVAPISVVFSTLDSHGHFHMGKNYSSLPYTSLLTNVYELNY